MISELKTSLNQPDQKTVNMRMTLMYASYWPVGLFAGDYTPDLPSCRSKVFLRFSGIYEKKKLVELQLSRTASDVLSEFETVIINTVKIKRFSAENEASS